MRILAFALVLYWSSGRRVQGPSEHTHEAAREKHRKPQKSKATTTVLHGFNQATSLSNPIAKTNPGLRRHSNGPLMAVSSAVTALTDLILHEEPDWIAVSKPPGVAMQEGDNNLLAQLNKMFRSPLKLVQTLDTETSGVLLVARNTRGAEKLHWYLSEPFTVKTYKAIVRGLPYNRIGTWTQSISQKAEGRKNPRGLGRDRVPAETEYRVVGANETSHLSLAEMTLRSAGPKHQLRKHAAVNGHAIAGDRRYGDRRHADHMERAYGLDGLMLHAETLRLRVDGVQHEFKAPYPSSWSSILETIPVSRKFRPKKKVVLDVELGEETAVEEEALEEEADEEEFEEW